MTVANFAPSGSRFRAFSKSRISPYVVIAIAIGAASLAWHMWIGLLGDVTWLITVNERWLAGERLYVDLLECNPPASILLYTGPVALAHWLGARSETLVSSFGFSLTGLVVVLARAILARAGRLAQIGPVAFAAALIALAFLPGDAFMERDTAAALFGLPFLALCEARANRSPVDWRHALAAGIGVGLMVCLKAPFALAAGLPALYVVSRAGPRVLLEAVEIPAAAAVAIAYAVVVVVGFPAFDANILPMLVDVYLAVRLSLLELVHSEGGLDFLALMLTSVYLVRGRLAGDSVIAIAGLAAIGGFAGYVVQGKGWLYQAYPALCYAGIFAGLAIERAGPAPRERALCALAFAVSLAVGILVGRWGVSILVATLAAGLLGDFISRERRDLTRRLVLLAAAASLGAACASFEPCADSHDALGRALVRLGPHPTVMAITESFGFVHPRVRRLGARWVQSVPTMFATSGARLLMDEHPGDAALAAKLAPYIERERALLISDISTKRPDAIFVGPLGSRFHEAIWSDPEVTGAMRDYRLFAVNDDPDHTGELWVRRDLVDPRPAIAPEAAR